MSRLSVISENVLSPKVTIVPLYIKFSLNATQPSMLKNLEHKHKQSYMSNF